MRHWGAVLAIVAMSCVNRGVLSPSAYMKVTPTRVPADGVTAATVGVTAMGSDGRFLPSDITLELFTSGAAEITPFGPADANGWYFAQIRSTSPGVQTLTVKAASARATTDLHASAVVTFTPVGPLVPIASSIASTLDANPNVITADGVSSSVLTVTVRDTGNLPMRYAPIAWAATGSNNTLIAGSPNTDVNGVATATLTSTTAEIKTVTASSGAMQVSTSVTFTSGNISNGNCTLALNPNGLVADGSAVATLTFFAGDVFGNPIANAPVTFTASGSNNTLTPASGTTNSAGIMTATLASSTAETKTVTAVSGAITLNRQVVFWAGEPNSGMSVLTANPNVVTADGVSASTVTVVLEDTFGNPASGQGVTFSSTGSNDHFTQSTCVTDASGQCVTALASTTAEEKTVVATFAGGGSLSTDVFFVAGAPSSSMTTLHASPTVAIANGASTLELMATVLDFFGNAVAFELVTLSSTGSNDTLTPSSGTTDSSGVFTATMASMTAEPKTVTATAGSATATAAVTFVAGAPSSTTTIFGANPTSVTADGTSNTTLTVTVKDAQGNPVTNQAVTFASSGSNNTFGSPPSGTTNNAGVFTTTLASTTAETKNLTATIGSLVQTTSVTFVPGAPSSVTTTFVASPNTVTADASSTTALTVTVFDVHGNAVANQAVTLSSSGSNNFFGDPTGTTNSSGVYTTTLSSSKAEPKTVTATAGAAVKTTTVTFVAGAPVSANCSLTANPTSVTADGSSTTQLTFLVEDAFGNPIPNQNVTLASSGSNNGLVPTSGTTNSGGQFMATLSSTKAEVKTVSGTAGTATANTTVTFNAGAVSSATTTLVANPNTVAADGSSIATLVTTALDAQGNPVPSQSVSMSASGGNNTFNPPTGSTNTSGQFTTTLASTTVQNEVASALVAGGVTANANVYFIAPLVSVTSSTIVASPNALIADGTATTTITVTVLNDSNAPVQDAPVTMTATGTANVFSPASGTTNTSGVFTTTLKSTQAAVKSVTATVDGTGLTTTVTFQPGAAAHATTTLVANPNTVTADGASTSTLTVVVRDINGNAVPSQGVSLVVSGGNNTLTPAAGNSDATGTFTATLASTMAQTETVTATINGFTENANVTFVPGVVSGVTTTFVASPTSTIANGTSAITFTTTVRDAEGNLVPNQSVVLASTGSNNIFTPPSGSTNGAGVFTATMVSTTAQLKAVTATIGTVNENANVTFIAGPPSSTTSSLVLNPTSVTANGNTTTVKVTVADAQGNPVGSQSVVLSGSGTANTFTPGSGPTDANGVFTATLSSTLAQSENVMAAVGAVNLTAPMTFTAGSPNGTLSSLTASPNTLVANGVATTTLRVTVKDAQGNPVPSQTVSLGSTGTANTLSPTTGSTNSAGVFTATLASTMAQAKLVTATLGTVTETANVTFTAGPPNNSTTTFAAAPTTVTADGTSTSTLTLTVEDQYGNPVINQNVTFTSSGSSNTINPAGGVTNNVGVFTATMSSTMAQVKTVTATVASLTPTAAITFVAGAPSNTTSSVSASPNTLADDGVATTTLQVTVKDLTGNPVNAQSVTFTSTGSGYTLTPTTCATASNGLCTVTMKSTGAGTDTVSAKFAGVTVTTPVTFLTGSPNGTMSTLVASPNSIVANGTATALLTVTVEDATGNLLSNQTVSLSGGTSNVFTPASGTTNSVGVFTATVSSTVAQTETITATVASSLPLMASMTFGAGPATSANSSLGASPTTIVANNSNYTTVTITLRDAHNNLVPNQSVTFSSSGTSNTFTPTSCTTTASGTCTSNMTSTLAQGKTITATNATASANTPVTFVAGPPALSNTTFTASPNTVASDGNATSSLVLTVEDAYGNIVANANVTFVASGYGGVIANRFPQTNASGVAQSTIKSVYFGQRTITAKVGAIAPTALVTFSKPASCAGDYMLFPDLPGFSLPSPTEVTSADFNGDGFPDMAVTNNSNMVSVALGAGNGLFGPVTAYQVGASPLAVSAGDINGDGHVDCAVANAADANITVLRGAGNGNFTVSAFTDAVGNWDLVLGDMDGDGLADAVSVNRPGGTVSVRRGASNGSLGAASSQATSATPLALALGDINGDGHLDVAVVGIGSTSVDILMGTGSGTLNPKQSYTTTYPNAAVTIADFNRDGNNDVLVGADSNDLMQVLPGTGGGALGAAISTSLSQAPFAIAAADMSGDGIPDAILGFPQVVAIAIGKGDGTFKTPVQFNAGTQSVSVAIADVNGDGNQDVFTLDATEGNAGVLLGMGGGTLVDGTTTQAFGLGTTGADMADFNGDGNQDLAILDYYGNGVGIYLGKGDGTFAQKGSEYPAASPGGLTVGTIDSNSTIDIAVLDTNNLMILTGNGDGNFTSRPPIGLFTTCTEPPTLGKLGTDAYTDVVVPCAVSNQFAVLRGNGDGTFGAPTYYGSGLAGSPRSYAQVADFNGDGYADVIITASSSTNAALLLGTSNGALQTPTTFALSGYGGPLIAGTFENNGKQDVAIILSTTSVAVFHNNGAGSFSVLHTYTGFGNNVNFINTGDVDSDGWTDVICTGDGGFSVMRDVGSSTYVPTMGYLGTDDSEFVGTADFNRDGIMDLVTTSIRSTNGVGVFYTVHLTSGCVP